MSEPLTMSKVHEDFIRSLHKTEGATATHLLAELDATRAALQKAEEEYLALNKVHLEFVAESIKRFSRVEGVARELLAALGQASGDDDELIARATALLGDPIGSKT